MLEIMNELSIIKEISHSCENIITYCGLAWNFKKKIGIVMEKLDCNLG